jgi:predicted membrane-bound spermidine synthase
VTHQEFVAAYQAGRIRVRIDRDAAARLVSGLSLLPLVLLPILGLGVALAIVGYFVTGALIFVAALLLRVLVKRSSSGFLVWRALQDPAFYREAVAAKLLSIEDSTPSRSS